MAHPDRIRDRALRALAVVVAVALGVGAILAVGAYAAARMAGLTDGGHRPPAQAAPATPSRAPSATEPTSGKPTAAGSTPARVHQAHAAQQSAHRRPRRHSTAHRRRHQHHRHRAATGTVTLRATRARVQPMSRVDLSGRCGCRSGTTLVVQRRAHGHWSRFPATATASHGRFHTWVMTGRRGPNRFRVVLPGGPASSPVTITVG